MTFDAFVQLLWRHRWVMVAGIVLGGLSAIAVTMLTPKVYSATCVAFVSAVPPQDKSTSYEAAQFAVSRAKSYPPLLRSPQVIAGVIKELRLDLGEDELANRLTAVNPVETLLLQISAEADTPELAPRIANSAARHLATEIKQLETAGITRTSPIDVQVAVPATVPRSAAQPRPLVNLVLGLLVGSVGAALVALVRDARQQGRPSGPARKLLRRKAADPGEPLVVPKPADPSASA